MKKKILLISVMVMLFATLFAIGASAAIVRHETDPGLNCDDSAVTILDYDAFNNSTAKDKESKTVLTDGTYFYVVPSYYVFTTNSNFAPSLTNINAAMKAADSTITEDLFTDKKVNYVRIELPTWISNIDQGTGKLEYWTGIKEFRFGTTLEKISALNAFTGCSNLEAISDISHFTALGDAAFSGCGKLTGHINWPAAVTFIVGSAFSNTNITSITIPEGVKSIGSFAFKNCDFTEVILPNSVVSMGKGAFSGCQSMTTFSFGAGFTTLARVNNDYETLNGCSSLKYVYMPVGFLTAIQGAKANDYKHIFNNLGSAKVTFFFTGTEAEATQIKELMASTNNNPNLGNAIIEKYNEQTDYTNYGTTKNSNVIVYGYNLCDAFYGSDHDEKAELEYRFSGEKYISSFCSYTSCTRCPISVETEIVAPLFTVKGYSKSEDAFMYDVKVDNSAVEAYETFNETKLSYGLTVCGNKSLGSLLKDDGTVTNDSVLKIIFNDTEYANIQIKINNISTEESKAFSIYACAYAIEDSVVSYIGQDMETSLAKTTSAPVAICYNDIKDDE